MGFYFRQHRSAIPGGAHCGEIRPTPDGIDSYIRTYDEDIEDCYRADFFSLRI
jgi:hypothetical protein